MKALVGVLFSAVVLSSAWQGPAGADVSEVEGNAYGCFANTSFSFDPNNIPPPTQFGPVPEVTLPSGGGSETDSAACTIPVAPGDGVPPLFSAGSITVTTEGTTGPTGSVTSSADLEGVNVSGVEAFTAANLSSTCTADESGVTGSTTVTSGGILTDPDNAADDPVPNEPAPGYTVFVDLGVATSNYIFNEQIENADGSITVNALRIEPLTGPVTGTAIIGQVVCGVTSDGNGGGGTTTTTEPDGGGTTTTQPDGGTTTTTEPDGGGTTTTTEPDDGGTTTTTEPDDGGTTTTTEPDDGGTTTTTEPDDGDDGDGDCDEPEDFVGQLIFQIFRGISDLFESLGISGFEDFGCDLD